MKNILCLVDSLASGGAQRQLVGLSIALQNAGYNVKVITYFDLPFYLLVLQTAGVLYENIDGADNQWKRILLINKAIKEFKPDWVIAFLDIPGIIACVCKLLQPNKWKLLVSDRNTTQSMTRLQKLKFFLYNRADFIVPNSYSQEGFIKKHFPKLGGKAHVITNFVDIDKFSPSAKKRVYNEKRTIICVGRVAPQKNVVRFLNVINTLKDKRQDFKVEWFGASSDKAYLQACEDAIRTFSLEKYFKFHAPSTDIITEYQNADIFCLPSLYEGFPNVLCEAMSCGLPVLSSNVCDNPTIVRDGENGYLFNPLDIIDMVDKIDAMLSLAEIKLTQMGEQSRKISLDLFAIKEFTQKYIQLLES